MVIKDTLPPSNHTANSPNQVEHNNTATTELFKKWREEDAKMTPEEIEAENRLFDEIIEGINEVRRNSGMRTI
jgi:hypothetical protein